MCRRSQTKIHTNRNAEFEITEEAAIHWCLFFFKSFIFSSSVASSWWLSSRSHCAQIWFEALPFTQLFANDPKWCLLRARVSVRRLLTCTGCPGNGVDVIMYADDVSSSINDKVKHNYQVAMSLWLLFFPFLFFKESYCYIDFINYITTHAVCSPKR